MTSATPLPPEHAEEAVWIQAAQHDPRGFAPLYARYHKPIFLFIRKRVGSNDQAGDLTSQVFLKALLALPRYEARGVPFRAWLYRIALNEVLMHYRRSRGRVFMDVEAADGMQLLSDAMDPDAGQPAADLERLTHMISRLRPAEAVLIELHWFDRLSYAEVGQVLGIAEAAAKMRTHRVLRKLRGFLFPRQMNRQYRIRPDSSPIPTDAEVGRYRDFGRLVYNHQHMTRPLYKRPLYRDPRALIAILIIVLLAILISETTQDQNAPEILPHKEVAP